jgi:hypothetical protein
LEAAGINHPPMQKSSFTINITLPGNELAPRVNLSNFIPYMKQTI